MAGDDGSGGGVARRGPDPAFFDAQAAAGDAALTAVLAARHAQAAAAADEADALLRLAAVYPDVDGYGRELSTRGVLHELMAALGCSQRSAANRLGWAQALAEVPALAAAMRAGEVDAARSHTTLQALGVLPSAELRREAVARLLAAHAAHPDGLTAAQWSRLLGRVIAALDPAGAENRQAGARRDRHVTHRPPAAAGDDGELTLRGPAERVAICAETVDALARAWAAAGQPGTLDQLRFDALEWLITHPADTTTADSDTADTDTADTADTDTADDDSADAGDTDTDTAHDDSADAGRDRHPTDRARPGPGGCPCGGRWRGQVVAQVTVSLATLLAIDEAPGHLDGLGAIPASVARELAARADVWRRLLTDPADGHLVTQAITSYRPTAAMRRYVLTRAQHTCASRGCTCRRRLQLDHTTPWPLGPTSATELAPLHEPHHDGKTHGRWRHALDPHTGALTQTSPLGRTYVTPPLPPLGGTHAGPTASITHHIDRFRLPWPDLLPWAIPYWATDPPADLDDPRDHDDASNAPAHTG